MFECVCIYIYIYIHTHIYIYIVTTYIYIYIYILSYIYIYTLKYIFLNELVHEEICIFSDIFFRSYICFQLFAFVREHIWRNALLMEYLMRLELTRVFSLNGFQLVMGLYRCHFSFFSLGLFTLVYFTPNWSVIFYMFLLLSVCLCVGSFQILQTVIFSEWVFVSVCVLIFFLYVYTKLHVIYIYIYVYIYIYIYIYRRGEMSTLLLEWLYNILILNRLHQYTI